MAQILARPPITATQGVQPSLHGQSDPVGGRSASVHLAAIRAELG